MANFFSNLKLQIGHITVSPGVLQAGVIILLVFLLLLVMARITRTYISWYTSGWYIWVGLGFLAAIIIEGFFVVSGSTVFTAVLGWKGAPKPIQVAVDAGRTKLIDVLGAQDIKAPEKEPATSQSVVADFESLDYTGRNEANKAICNPGQE